jgi:cytidine deaminase
MDDLPESAYELVQELLKHRADFEKVRDSPRYNELNKFWLRKSKQPVLSVLMIQRDDGPVRYFRGVNLEVSMPTGSLCAERNAIGSALAQDPSIVRNDFKMIAILALKLDKNAGTKSSLLGKRARSDDDSSSSSSSSAAAAADDDESDRIVKRLKMDSPQIMPSLTLPGSQVGSNCGNKHGLELKFETPVARAVRPIASPLAMSSKPAFASAFKKDHDDLNPISPCGACNEWLKKIAEVNPDFAVLTTADVSARRWYVKSVK